jgi:hypothetical protein
MNAEPNLSGLVRNHNFHKLTFPPSQILVPKIQSIKTKNNSQLIHKKYLK